MSVSSAGTSSQCSLYCLRMASLSFPRLQLALVAPVLAVPVRLVPALEPCFSSACRDGITPIISKSHSRLPPQYYLPPRCAVLCMVVCVEILNSPADQCLVWLAYRRRNPSVWHRVTSAYSAGSRNASLARHNLQIQHRDLSPAFRPRRSK